MIPGFIIGLVVVLCVVALEIKLIIWFINFLAKYLDPVAAVIIYPFREVHGMLSKILKPIHRLIKMKFLATKLAICYNVGRNSKLSSFIIFT